jgi:hypothetical protein
VSSSPVLLLLLFSACFVLPDGCYCLVQFLFDVPKFVDSSCLFGIDKRLEDATETTPHGDQRLHVQQWEVPDDGHNGVRNMLSNVE